jgi:hypothetical protein
MDEWMTKSDIYIINTMHLCMTVFYPAAEKDEICCLVENLMELEIMLSEVSQCYKDKYQMSSLISGS